MESPGSPGLSYVGLTKYDMRWNEIFESHGPLAEWYLNGGCLEFAFAIHWMTGWPMYGIGEAGQEHFTHFVVRGHDGNAWDAAGSRPFATAASEYATDPDWREVDAHKLITRSGADENEITEACKAAIQILGSSLANYIKRQPE